jgi:hypothetical protein
MNTFTLIEKINQLVLTFNQDGVVRGDADKDEFFFYYL